MAKKSKTELLAPAGGFEALVAAVQNGADAVYVGGTVFSARAGAQNFDEKQLAEAVRYCHIRGVKLFVTLNTLIKEQEYQKAVDFAVFAYEAGVDALIIQDLGLASVLHAVLPDFRLHASTQMTVHSLSGAKKLEELGFKRVVLARELTREQIFEIKKNTGLEIEIFVHGAICNSYSGQCLFSSFLGGRSGNRGRCAQPCRLMYTLKNGDEALRKGYLLSPKDMCLLAHLEQIKAAEIDSLKIEGRLKKPEYVATVTKIYRKYLDKPSKPSGADIDELLAAFNRSGFTDGYFAGNTGGHMMSFESPSNISEEKFGSDIKKTFAEGANFRRTEVYAKCEIKIGKPMRMELSDDDGNTVCAAGTLAEAARGSALDYDRAYAQLSKFGSVPFELKRLTLDMDEQAFCRVSDLNALRREACDKLMEKRAEVHTEHDACSAAYIGIRSGNTDTEVSAEVQTLHQAEALLDAGLDRLYVPAEVAREIKNRACGKTELVTRLEAVINNESESQYDNVPTQSVLCSSLGAAYALCGKHRVYGDYRLNVYNSNTVGFYLENGFERVTLSPELSIKDICELSKKMSVGACDVLAYGRIPLMTMKNCVIKSCTKKCAGGKSGYYLTDRMGEKLPVLCQKNSCTNLLLNSKPIYMADKIDELRAAGVRKIMLMFTVEGGEQCRRISDEYIRAMNGEKVENSMGNNEFTRGHFYKSVL